MNMPGSIPCICARTGTKDRRIRDPRMKINVFFMTFAPRSAGRPRSNRRPPPLLRHPPPAVPRAVSPLIPGGGPRGSCRIPPPPRKIFPPPFSRRRPSGPPLSPRLSRRPGRPPPPPPPPPPLCPAPPPRPFSRGLHRRFFPGRERAARGGSGNIPGPRRHGGQDRLGDQELHQFVLHGYPQDESQGRRGQRQDDAQEKDQLGEQSPEFRKKTAQDRETHQVMHQNDRSGYGYADPRDGDRDYSQPQSVGKRGEDHGHDYGRPEIIYFLVLAIHGLIIPHRRGAATARPNRVPREAAAGRW